MSYIGIKSQTLNKFISALNKSQILNLQGKSFYTWYEKINISIMEACFDRINLQGS